MDDKTRLKYWFPLLEKAGLPIPKTIMVEASEEEIVTIYNSFDTGKLGKGFDSLAEKIKIAADTIGYPCFLRTDHFSGKHNWDKTCFLQSADDIKQHVFEIAYFWECVNMFGAPCDTWVVREFLPTIPHGVCQNYGNMPICKEFRFFVKDGTIKCFHPYWPLQALNDGAPQYNGNFDYEAFCTLENEAEVSELVTAAAQAVAGEWSIDVLETKNGWYITDMAEAHKSYHWEPCDCR